MLALLQHVAGLPGFRLACFSRIVQFLAKLLGGKISPCIETYHQCKHASTYLCAYAEMYVHIFVDLLMRVHVPVCIRMKLPATNKCKVRV